MGRLDGQGALVTGGGRGIGRGIVLALAREGAGVAVGDLEMERAEATAALVRAAGGRAVAVALDVSDPDSAAAGVAATLQALGRLDILVNNAGISGDHYGADAVTLDDFDRCYRVNVNGIWIMSRAVAPHFKRQGGGTIVNIASIAGRRGGAALPDYSTSKAAAISLTQSLAAELGPSKINVNAVCPDLVWTDMTRKTEALSIGDPAPDRVARRERFDRALERLCVLGREQTPEDIGRAVAFFASQDARNITGQALNVDGGMVLN